MMWPSVEAAWPAVAREFEGVLNFPYLDTEGLVTVGVGSLFDTGSGTPPDAFLSLPWLVDGVAASRAQAAAAWLLVKSRQDLAAKGGTAFRDTTLLRLPDQAVNALLFARTREFWSVLSAQLPGLEGWPADAQLALINMGYQNGPHFLGSGWPNFTASAHAEDFAGCAAQCSIKNAPLRRNLRNLQLFRNAAVVKANRMDRAVLWHHGIPIKEDPVQLTDAERLALIRDLAAEVRKSIPTVAAIAKEVLDSKTSDLIAVADRRGKVRPVTALSEIHKAVSRGIGTATHL